MMIKRQQFSTSNNPKPFLALYVMNVNIEQFRRTTLLSKVSFTLFLLFRRLLGNYPVSTIEAVRQFMDF